MPNGPKPGCWDYKTIDTMDYQPQPDRYSNGMIYRRCGNSGVELPVISLGLWHNFGYIDSYATGLEMVRYAFDHGICHFDVANNYGPPPGSAEENFGRMMKQCFATHRDEMFITTKAGHEMWAGPYGGNSSRKNLMASIDQSLRRMRLDYVDLFYSHRYDGVTPIDETMQALVDIVHQGKALYIGLSKYPIDKLLYALSYLHEAGIPCLAYQDRYHMFDRHVEEKHLQLCHSKGIGVVAFSPLAQGILSDKYLHGIPSDSRAARPEGHLKTTDVTPEKIARVARLKPLADQRGQSISQLALAWVLRHNEVSSVVVGARTLDQLKDNLHTVENLTFTPAETELIEEILK